MNFQPCSVPWAWASTPTYRDLVTAFPAVSGFFPHDPHGEEGYRQRLDHLRHAGWLAGEAGQPEPRRERRERVAAALADYNRRVGAGPAALTHLEALSRGEALAVFTGQQAGFLTGPLYTLYKAVTAIGLARQLTIRLGHTVVPAFWIASEDHDFAEVATVTLLASDGSLRRLRLPGPAVAGASVGHLPLPPAARDLMAQLVEWFSDRPFGGETVAGLLQVLSQSATLAEAFARTLARLFREEGLILVDPLLPTLRRELSGFFQRAWEGQSAIEASLQATGERLRRAGYPAPLGTVPEQAALFIYHQGRRTALYREGTVYRSRAGDLRLTSTELARLAAGAPERFSPGATLRSLAQDHLFPVVAQVSGPGEVAYLAQTAGLYRLFDLEMPVITPRLSLTLVPAEAEEALSHRYGVDLRRPGFGLGEARDRALANLDQIGIPAQFAAERERIRQGYTALIDRLAGGDSEFAALGQGNLERILRQVDYLEMKAWQRHQRHHRPVLEEFRRLENLLLPGGRLQERVHNAVPWLCRYGPGWLRGLAAALPIAAHQIVIWEGEEK